jgi:NAD(P)-dependent dehydrogenase (short-subunit alcohol dehydrogenase family)
MSGKNPDILKGRVALVTGASRGIGAAIARELAGAGAHVILLARTQGGLEEVDDEIRAAGGSATLVPMDLNKLEDIDKLGPSILERFGRLDILVCNAAILGPLTPAHQVEPKDWDKVMRVNFMANARLVRALDPLLRASEAGRVLFMTTGLASKALAYWSPYAASKAALDIFARTYAAETGKTNLRVNLFSPGVVDTDMLGKAFPGGYSGATQTPAAVAKKVLALLGPDCGMHGEIVQTEAA